MLFRIIIFGCVRLIPWRVLLTLSKYKEYDGSTLVAGTELLIIYDVVSQGVYPAAIVSHFM